MPSIYALYGFIERADTMQKAAIAERWFREHKSELEPSVYRHLIEALEERTRLIIRETMRQINLYEKNLALVNTLTGEVVNA